jgi:hypothetical protein
LQQRLRQGPPAQAPTPTGAKAGGPAVAKAGEPEAVTPAAASDGPAPGRWTLEGIRTTFAWLKGYTRSGVWRLLRRCDLRLRSAAVQQFSPDPEYAAKCADLEMALGEARR